MSDNTVTITPVIDESAVAAYAAGDQSAKGRIRATWERALKSAVSAGDFQSATNANATLAALAPAKSAKVEIDPRLVVAQRVADLLAAADMLARGLVIPTDLTVEWSDEDYTDGFLDLPTVEADGESAAKIAGQKLTRTDKRRSIDGVVARAFSTVESGTYLTIREIAKRGALDDYAPSDGAVAARLFPSEDRDCTLDGVVPVERVGTQPRGARKM